MECSNNRRLELLKLENIKKSFGKVEALKGVDITVNRGEVIGLVGDNGAGKSTLIKIISGALIPDYGRIFFEGREVHFKSPRDARALGVETVYQDLSLCETLTVAQNIFLGREPIRVICGFPFLDKTALYNNTQKVLDELRINIPSVKALVRDLSGGQRQAVAIGRAVTFEPKLLILDEPTAALAVREAQKVLDLVKKLKDMNISVILVSHRLQDIMETADRVVVMYEGKKVAEHVISDLNFEKLASLVAAAHE